jgi:alcohol dehydrogenase class IV
MALIKYLTDIHLEAGARRQLAAECERIDIEKPLVVTDAGVRAAAGARCAAGLDARRGLRRHAAQPH